ncbi:hypothetical protein I3271_07430 [Photobacterium leiognathi]|uniref:hypothetical protein n=1 Tax=Photobacterium leiognathi TaxID=553611 RepID=UPI001EDD335B|nr:hypothetical protein [Photobacterium leiognathi]MCG3884517.1 hypothetical protein [Photobacterium leiognathi]
MVDGNRLLLASQQLLAGFDDSKNYLMDLSSKEGYDGLFVYYVEHGCHELSSTTTRAIESLKRQIRTIETKTNRIQSSSIMKTMGQEFRKCGCCGERIQTSLIRGYLVSKLDSLQSNIQYGIDVQCPNCCSRSGYPFTEKEHDRLNDYKEKLASLKSRLLEKKSCCWY